MAFIYFDGLHSHGIKLLLNGQMKTVSLESIEVCGSLGQAILVLGISCCQPQSDSEGSLAYISLLQITFQGDNIFQLIQNASHGNTEIS